MYFLGLNLFNGFGCIGLHNPIARGSSIRAVPLADAIVEETVRERKSCSLFSIFAPMHRAKIRSIY
jgi:hypothetical protein